MNLLAEELIGADGAVVRHAHEADVAAVAYAAESLVEGLLGANSLRHAVCAHAVGELQNLGDALFAALLHHVGCAEFLSERLTLGVAGHDDNLLRTELLSADDCAQANRAVANNDDGLAGGCASCVRCVPAGAEHVGCRHEVRNLLCGGCGGGLDEGAVCEGYASVFCLGAVGACTDEGVTCCDCLEAAGGVACGAGFAFAAGDAEGAYDEVAGGYGGDLGAYFYDFADVFVAHCPVVDGLCAAVGPQVGAADAGCCELDDGVGGFEQGRLVDFVDDDLAGGFHNN